MRILIIGASGFVGSAIESRLSEHYSNHEFTLTYHSNVIQSSHRVVKFDFFQNDYPDKLIEDFDLVLFAAEVEKQEMLGAALEVYKQKVQAFVNACKNTRLIYISSDAVFSGEVGSYNEKDRPDPMTPYGENLLIFENAIRRELKNFVIVRFSYAYGQSKYKKDKRTTKAFENIQAKKIQNFQTHMYKSPVDVREVAKQVCDCALQKYVGVKHIPGTRKTIYQFYIDRLVGEGISLDIITTYFLPDHSLLSDSITRDTSLTTETSQRLIDVLTPEQIQFLPRANFQVLWGWKRDVGKYSRIVYFSAKLLENTSQIYSSKPYLFYFHRAETKIILQLQEMIEKNSEKLFGLFGCGNVTAHVTTLQGEFSEISLHIGSPREADIDRVTRLQQRTPNEFTNPVTFTFKKLLPDVSQYFPADLYVGSGVSYEAGVPTLCQMHDYFCVDNHDLQTFAYGKYDRLIKSLVANPEQTVADFYSVHTKAIQAQPTFAQKTISMLLRCGNIGQVFSDNVDNLLCKVRVPFERTRGSGVFNERYPAHFKTKKLIVIGVAADRRQIIQQARKAGMTVTIINPCLQVSPSVQHLNYYHQDDNFHRVTAETFFRHVLQQLNLTIEKDAVSATGLVQQGIFHPEPNEAPPTMMRSLGPNQP